jgi:hypothetical protein
MLQYSLPMCKSDISDVNVGKVRAKVIYPFILSGEYWDYELISLKLRRKKMQNYVELILDVGCRWYGANCNRF